MGGSHFVGNCLMAWCLQLALGISLVGAAGSPAGVLEQQVSAEVPSAAPAPFYLRKLVALDAMEALAPVGMSRKKAYWEAVDRLPLQQQQVVRRMSRRIGGAFPVMLDITAGADKPRIVYATHITASFLGDSDLWRMNLLPNLEYLDLLIGGVSGTGLLTLDNPNLHSLCLPAKGVTDQQVRELLADEGALPRLRHLDVPIRDQALTAAVCKVLRRLSRLESVHFLGPCVTDEWLKHLAVTDLMRQVKGLGLRGTAVTNGGLLHVSEEAGNLTHLALVDSAITPHGLVCLRAMGNLEELHLESGRFDDTVLERLGTMSKLRVLVLDHCPVTDRVLAAVEERMPGLEFLSLVNTKVSPEAARQWQRARPQVRMLRLARPECGESVQGWTRGLQGLWDDTLCRPGRAWDSLWSPGKPGESSAKEAVSSPGAATRTLTRALYVCNDANMNVTALANTSTAVRERSVYDPYGKATGNRDASPFPLCLQHRDGETLHFPKAEREMN